ncbi:uncharacterized protein LOC126375807 [Pectinophora gossypiella]|uniref:uncharacterized protein LOC126375807 n=1 Tax=Pectinophora gossypiella TaxID=13191 RepID=UPI00214E8AFD|nr:uncharacterized protein LOC126375807 [Pectinophora gossypiella]
MHGGAKARRRGRVRRDCPSARPVYARRDFHQCCMAVYRGVSTVPDSFSHRLWDNCLNQELLITLIQERPVIWDKTIDDYKNKRLKYDSWKEIFIHFQPTFEDLSGDEKNKFGMVVSDSAERDEKKKSSSMNFFMGIADTVDKFSDENMIDFQFQVISIIKNIQQRQCTQYIPTSRNQWDQGHQGYLSGTASSNAQSSTYGYSTAARSGYGISRPQTSSHDFGHGSGLEPIHYRPESQLSVHSVNAESISADSQVSIEDEFDFSTALE